MAESGPAEGHGLVYDHGIADKERSPAGTSVPTKAGPPPVRTMDACTRERGPEDRVSCLEMVRAIGKCARGVRWKPEVADMCLPGHRLRAAVRLSGQLNRGTWRPSRLRRLEVRLPKPRTVMYPGFSERVVHRALVDARLYRELTRPLVHDSCACQRGKGPHYALRRLLCQLSRLRLTGSEWLVRLDVRHFFDSLDHGVLRILVNRHVSSPADRRVVMTHVNRFPRGISLGSQLSQMLANLYLSGLDHHLLERCRVLAFSRYADDLVLVCRDVRHARETMDAAWRWLSSRGLSLNGRSFAQPLRRPFGYLHRRIGPVGGAFSSCMTSEGVPRASRHIVKVLAAVGREHADDSMRAALAHYTGRAGARLRRMVSSRRGWRGAVVPLRARGSTRRAAWSSPRTRRSV